MEKLHTFWTFWQPILLLADIRFKTQLEINLHESQQCYNLSHIGIYTR